MTFDFLMGFNLNLKNFHNLFLEKLEPHRDVRKSMVWSYGE